MLHQSCRRTYIFNAIRKQHCVVPLVLFEQIFISNLIPVKPQNLERKQPQQEINDLKPFCVKK